MHRFLAGTGSPASPIQLHSCCRCTRGRDWKCTFSFPCAIFLCTFCIILYEYQSSDIDASILAGSCEIITWLPCVLQVCVRVRAMLYSRLVEPSRHGTDKVTSRD